MFSHQVLTTSLSCLLYLSSQSQHSGSLFAGIVGRISPPTWAAMETFLASVGNGQYTAMATALVQMGATDSAVDITSFSRDLEKIFSAVQVTLLKRFLQFVESSMLILYFLDWTHQCLIVQKAAVHI
jgi:predicted unusual protein kinase regulating ubiquinone biosynthesis (AarF/ABC1/UbiB family)